MIIIFICKGESTLNFPDSLSLTAPPHPYLLQLHHADIHHIQPQSSLALTQIMATHLTILVLIEGECVLKRENHPYPMRQDTVYICHAGSTFALSSEHLHTHVAMLHIELYFPHPDDSKQLLLARDMQSLSLPEEATFLYASAKCQQICSAFRSTHALHRWRAQIDATELLFEMVTAVHANSVYHPQPEDGLVRARNYIAKHPEQTLTLEQLSQLAGLSAKHFSDVFKKTYGQSAHDYITEIRLTQAKQLMLRSGYKLKDIAHEVGYRDEFYFSRVFKKETGVSPSQYINKRKQKVAAYACVSTLGYLLPLDIVPYAAPLHPKWSGYYLERYGADIPYHLEYGHADPQDHAVMRRIEEVNPDWILCSHAIQPWEHHRLSQYAKVITLPQEQQGSWRIGLYELADLFDMHAEAKQWIHTFDQRTAHARSLLTHSDGSRPSVLFVRMLREQLYSLGSAGLLDYVYHELGVQRPQDTPADNNEDDLVTWEQLQASDVEHICILIRQDSETLEHWHRLRQSSRWLDLPAVRQHRLHILSSSPWREYSPIALTRIREELIQYLSAKSPCTIR